MLISSQVNSKNIPLTKNMEPAKTGRKNVARKSTANRPLKAASNSPKEHGNLNDLSRNETANLQQKIFVNPKQSTNVNILPERSLEQNNYKSKYDYYVFQDECPEYSEEEIDNIEGTFSVSASMLKYLTESQISPPRFEDSDESIDASHVKNFPVKSEFFQHYQNKECEEWPFVQVSFPGNHSDGSDGGEEPPSQSLPEKVRIKPEPKDSSPKKAKVINIKKEPEDPPEDNSLNEDVCPFFPEESSTGPDNTPLITIPEQNNTKETDCPKIMFATTLAPEALQNMDWNDPETVTTELCDRDNIQMHSDNENHEKTTNVSRKRKKNSCPALGSRMRKKARRTIQNVPGLVTTSIDTNTNLDPSNGPIVAKPKRKYVRSGKYSTRKQLLEIKDSSSLMNEAVATEAVIELSAENSRSTASPSEATDASESHQISAASDKITPNDKFPSDSSEKQKGKKNINEGVLLHCEAVKKTDIVRDGKIVKEKKDLLRDIESSIDEDPAAVNKDFDIQQSLAEQILVDQALRLANQRTSPRRRPLMTAKEAKAFLNSLSSQGRTKTRSHSTENRNSDQEKSNAPDTMSQDSRTDSELHLSDSGMDEKSDNENNNKKNLVEKGKTRSRKKKKRASRNKSANGQVKDMAIQVIEVVDNSSILSDVEKGEPILIQKEPDIKLPVTEKDRDSSQSKVTETNEVAEKVVTRSRSKLAPSEPEREQEKEPTDVQEQPINSSQKAKSYPTRSSRRNKSIQIVDGADGTSPVAGGEEAVKPEEVPVIIIKYRKEAILTKRRVPKVPVVSKTEQTKDLPPDDKALLPLGSKAIEESEKETTPQMETQNKPEKASLTEKNILLDKCEGIEKENTLKTRDTSQLGEIKDEQVSGSDQPTENIHSSDIAQVGDTPVEPRLGQVSDRPVLPMLGQVSDRPEEPTLGQVSDKPVEPTLDQVSDRPEEPTLGQVSNKPVEPTLDQVSDLPEEPTLGQVSDEPVEPTLAQVSDSAVEPTFDQVCDKPVEPPLGQVNNKPMEPTLGQVSDSAVEPTLDQVSDELVEPTFGQVSDKPVQPMLGQVSDRPEEPTLGQVSDKPVEPTLDQVSNKPVEDCVKLLSQKEEEQKQRNEKNQNDELSRISSLIDPKLLQTLNDPDVIRLIRKLEELKQMRVEQQIKQTNLDATCNSLVIDTDLEETQNTSFNDTILDNDSSGKDDMESSCTPQSPVVESYKNIKEPSEKQSEEKLGCQYSPSSPSGSDIIEISDMVIESPEKNEMPFSSASIPFLCDASSPESASQSKDVPVSTLLENIRNADTCISSTSFLQADFTSFPSQPFPPSAILPGYLHKDDQANGSEISPSSTSDSALHSTTFPSSSTLHPTLPHYLSASPRTVRPLNNSSPVISSAPDTTGQVGLSSAYAQQVTTSIITSSTVVRQVSVNELVTGQPLIKSTLSSDSSVDSFFQANQNNFHFQSQSTSQNPLATLEVPEPAGLSVKEDIKAPANKDQMLPSTAPEPVKPKTKAIPLSIIARDPRLRRKIRIIVDDVEISPAGSLPPALTQPVTRIPSPKPLPQPIPAKVENEIKKGEDCEEIMEPDTTVEPENEIHSDSQSESDREAEDEEEQPDSPVRRQPKKKEVKEIDEELLYKTPLSDLHSEEKETSSYARKAPVRSNAQKFEPRPRDPRVKPETSHHPKYNSYRHNTSEHPAYVSHQSVSAEQGYVGASSSAASSDHPTYLPNYRRTDLPRTSRQEMEHLGNKVVHPDYRNDAAHLGNRRYSYQSKKTYYNEERNTTENSSGEFRKYGYRYQENMQNYTRPTNDYRQRWRSEEESHCTRYDYAHRKVGGKFPAGSPDDDDDIDLLEGPKVGNLFRRRLQSGFDETSSFSEGLFERRGYGGDERLRDERYRERPTETEQGDSTFQRAHRSRSPVRNYDMYEKKRPRSPRWRDRPPGPGRGNYPGSSTGANL